MFSVAATMAMENCCGLVNGMAQRDRSRVTHTYVLPSVMVEHWGDEVGVHGCYHFYRLNTNINVVVRGWSVTKFQTFKSQQDLAMSRMYVGGT